MDEVYEAISLRDRHYPSVGLNQHMFDGSSITQLQSPNTFHQNYDQPTSTSSPTTAFYDTSSLSTYPGPPQSTAATTARAAILHTTANNLSELLQTSASTRVDELNNRTSAASLDAKLLLLAIVLCVLIVITVIGNTLVILAVLTTRRLRTVTNCFVMSLAVADWLVGIFVMPPSVAVYLIGWFKTSFGVGSFNSFFAYIYYRFMAIGVDTL